MEITTLDDIKKARQDLEKEVQELIYQFETKNKVTVREFCIDGDYRTTCMESYPRKKLKTTLDI